MQVVAAEPLAELGPVPGPRLVAAVWLLVFAAARRLAALTIHTMMLMAEVQPADMEDRSRHPAARIIGFRCMRV